MGLGSASERFHPVALTVAGSDSGGGAGIQADLRAFAAGGCFGTSVVTCVTAQNLDGVTRVDPIPPEGVTAQLRAVLQGFAVRAVKTGMLYSREIILAVAEAAADPGFPPLVVDPVMVAASGARLLQPDAEAAYREALLPLAAVMTPNLDEAAALWGRPVDSVDAMERAAEALGRGYGAAVLLKGGHLPGDPVDVLWQEGTLTRWTGRRLGGVSTHGAGCTLSAALAAGLAREESVAGACASARRHLLAALERPYRLSDSVRLLGASPD